MAKIFARQLCIFVEIGFELRFVAGKHLEFDIAAICIELPGNSQNRTELTRRQNRLIGRLVNNHRKLFGQSH